MMPEEALCEGALHADHSSVIDITNVQTYPINQGDAISKTETYSAEINITTRSYFTPVASSLDNDPTLRQNRQFYELATSHSVVAAAAYLTRHSCELQCLFWPSLDGEPADDPGPARCETCWRRTTCTKSMTFSAAGSAGHWLPLACDHTLADDEW
jgi:hypothetical protein